MPVKAQRINLVNQFLRLTVTLALIAAILPAPALARAKRSGSTDSSGPGQKSNEKRLTEQEKIVHLLNRITFGPSRGDIAAVQAIGIEKYVSQQLQPENIPEAPAVQDFVSSADSLNKSPDDLVLEYGEPAVKAALAAQGLEEKSDEGKMAVNKLRGNLYKKVSDATEQAKLLRAAESPRQLQEVMMDFWFNHFNIYNKKGNDRLWIGSFEEQAIRPYALGKFRDLLGATCHHAAMLVYLDNAQNSAPRMVRGQAVGQGLNENYARELMELHTLGVDGGYSQADVIQLARILTGLTIARHDNQTGELKSPTDKYGSYFNIKAHDMDDKMLLGQRIQASGEGEIEQALDLLARHPATAHHLSYQLAQYFVSDNPPRSLVDKLAAKYTKSDGDIRAVLKELLQSPEFNNPANVNCKFKSPYRYIVSILRATGARPDDYSRVQGYLSGQGEPLYGCLTPDGYKNVKDAWLNPDALVHRASFAIDYASGRFKGVDPGRVDAADLQSVLGMQMSDTTSSALARAPENLKGGMVLGSPEFMLY